MSVLITTVDELMIHFREALVALLPTMDKMMVAWRDEEAYEDWEAITEVLFERLVVESIRWSLPESEHATFKMAPYGVFLDSYVGFTFVSTIGPEVSATPSAFLSFATTQAPLDTACLRQLDDHGRLRRAEVTRVPIGSIRYSLRRVSDTGVHDRSDRVAVRL